jgi:ADP-heptose:LPS heptosyltransferase
MRVLLLENWGLGDAIMATAAIRMLEAEGHQVTLLCKENSAQLLKPSYPKIQFVTFDWPWTAFRGKYHLWKWPWLLMVRVISRLRRARFDAVLSVRPDPRDHLLMLLIVSRKRVGYGVYGTSLWLTESLPISADVHRVDAWQYAVQRLDPGTGPLPPELSDELVNASSCIQDGSDGDNVIVIHCGAAQAVRRWPLESWSEIIRRIRSEWSGTNVAVLTDPDGYGSTLEDVADQVITGLSLDALIATLASATVVMANDSGPGHISVALGVPVVTVFGPQVPAVFRPYGDSHCVVGGIPCRYHPCFDSCRFDKPYCMHDLTPDIVWPMLKPWLKQKLSGA